MKFQSQTSGRQEFATGTYKMLIVGGFENFDNEYNGVKNPQFVVKMKPLSMKVEGKWKTEIKDDNGDVIDVEGTYENKQGESVDFIRTLWLNLSVVTDKKGIPTGLKAAPQSWWTKLAIALTGKIEGTQYEGFTDFFMGDTVIASLDNNGKISGLETDPDNVLKTAEQLKAIAGGENPFTCKGLEGEPDRFNSLKKSKYKGIKNEKILSGTAEVESIDEIDDDMGSMDEEI